MPVRIGNYIRRLILILMPVDRAPLIAVKPGTVASERNQICQRDVRHRSRSVSDEADSPIRCRERY